MTKPHSPSPIDAQALFTGSFLLYETVGSKQGERLSGIAFLDLITSSLMVDLRQEWKQADLELVE